MRSWPLILIAVLVCTNAITAWRFYHTGYAASEAVHTAAIARAMAEALEKQKALVGAVQRAAEGANDERQKIEDRLAVADDAVERLRAAVRAAGQRADTATAAGADGATARALLADCSARYRDVARTADRLRAAVIGLQAYARAVSE